MSVKFNLFSLFLLIGLQSYAQSVEFRPFFTGGPVLNDQYGITSHITWYGYDYDRYKQNLENVATAGNDIVRLDFNSPGIGWETGKINYSIWDNVYKESQANGLKLLPIVYKPRYKKYTKDYGESYRALLTMCIRRYGNNVAGWEIWNEMDQMNAEDGTAPPEEYLPLLKDAFNTIKKEGKGAPILLGAIGDLNKSYLDDLLELKAANYFDVLSVHYYSAKNPPERIIPFYEKLNNVLKSHHVNKPVWLTETGYISTSDASDSDLFYTEVLPKVYKQLGINCSKSVIGVLYDKRMGNGVWNQDNINVGFGFQSCQLIQLNNLKNLSVSSVPVLMILFGEKFPKGFFEDLRSYVKRGGTVVFPEGGAFLYYDWDLDSNQIIGVGNKYYKQLHVGCLFSWEEDAKKRGISTMKRVRTVPELTSTYTWKSDDFASPKYLTAKNLHPGDELIPIVEGTDGKNTGLVAACYKFNSDLKGNVIIQTRPKTSNRTSESLQASRLPRIYILSYALGVEKVFAYCLRDKSDSQGYGITHRDLSSKPSYYTLQTLAKKLPSGSSRPIVREKDNQYIASWKNPQGKTIYCVWSSWVGQPSNIAITGRARFYDEKGERFRKNSFLISPRVTYIEGATSVEFVK